MSRIPIRSSFPNPLGDSSRESRTNFEDSTNDFLIFLMILPLAIAVFFHLAKSGEAPESPRSRQVILDVPESSRVDAQVTSGDNTVNLQNL